MQRQPEDLLLFKVSMWCIWFPGWSSGCGLNAMVAGFKVSTWRVWFPGQSRSAKVKCPGDSLLQLK